jgi:hypothetical protein
MSIKLKLSAVAFIGLFAATAIATTDANARQLRVQPCDLISWWACGGVTVDQQPAIGRGRDLTVRSYMDYTDPRYNSAMRDAGGGGGGGGGGR